MEMEEPFPLLSENSFMSEDFFNAVASDYPLIAKMLCYEDTFVPNTVAKRYIMGSASDESKLADYIRYLKK